MKKAIAIIVLGLLLSSNAYAGCYDDIQFSWYKDGSVARLKFYNKGGKHIRITDYVILDGEKDAIKEGDAGRTFVGSKESKTFGIQLWNNINYAAFANYECSYQKPYEKTVGDRAEDLSNSITGTIKGWFDDD